MEEDAGGNRVCRGTQTEVQHLTMRQSPVWLDLLDLLHQKIPLMVGKITFLG